MQSNNLSNLTLSDNKRNQVNGSGFAAQKWQSQCNYYPLSNEQPKTQVSKKNAMAEYKELALTNKKTNQIEKYKIYQEVDLTFLRKACKKGNGQTLLDFNMKKLELEYDYDTEEEQLNAAKSMLLRENLDAI